MRTVLENHGEKHIVEVPHTIVALYSLKEGQVFEVRDRENKNILIISMATKLNE